MTQGQIRNDRRFQQDTGQRSTQQHNERPNPPEIKFWIDKENNLINPELFSEIAEKWSFYVSKNPDKKRNKRSQIHKFYDEVLSLYNRLKNTPENFNNFLPFIKMIRAKVYYSLGREHIGDDFKDMMEKCLNQIETWKDFEVFKNFFEAFMGYYRFHRPKEY